MGGGSIRVCGVDLDSPALPSPGVCGGGMWVVWRGGHRVGMQETGLSCRVWGLRLQEQDGWWCGRASGGWVGARRCGPLCRQWEQQG